MNVCSHSVENPHANAYTRDAWRYGCKYIIYSEFSVSDSPACHLRADVGAPSSTLEVEGEHLQSRFEEDMSGFMKLRLSARVRCRIHDVFVGMVIQHEKVVFCRTSSSATQSSCPGSTMEHHPRLHKTHMRKSPQALFITYVIRIMTVILMRTQMMIWTCRFRCDL